jgi:hypothetical protein
MPETEPETGEDELPLIAHRLEHAPRRGSLTGPARTAARSPASSTGCGCVSGCPHQAAGRPADDHKGSSRCRVGQQQALGLAAEGIFREN